MDLAQTDLILRCPVSVVRCVYSISEGYLREQLSIDIHRGNEVPMQGLENLARNLGTYTASTDGMLLQKPTVTYGVFMDDDDNLYSNMKAI